jgi:hypothetical protein
VKIKVEFDIDPNELDRVPAILQTWNRNRNLLEPIRNHFGTLQPIAGTLPGTLGGTTLQLPGTQLEPVHQSVRVTVPTGTISGTNAMERRSVPQRVRGFRLDSVLMGCCVGLGLLVAGKLMMGQGPIASEALPRAASAVKPVKPQAKPVSTIDQLLPIQGD